MNKYKIEVYNEGGLMTLEVKKGYIYMFKMKGDNGFDRDYKEVLAIMENQYKELGELIKIVKEHDNIEPNF